MELKIVHQFTRMARVNDRPVLKGKCFSTPGFFFRIARIRYAAVEALSFVSHPSAVSTMASIDAWAGDQPSSRFSFDESQANAGGSPARLGMSRVGRGRLRT